MKYFARIVIITCLLLAVGTPVLGQRDAEQIEKALWASRARALADGIVKTTFKVNDLEKATILSTMAESWWDYDRQQAQASLEKSVDTLFFYSSDDIRRNPKEFAAAIKRVSSAASGRDQKQFDRLASILDNSKAQSEKDPAVDADTMIEIAMSAVKSYPQRAAEIGILAFASGQPRKFHHLYWELKRADSAAAERFIRAAVASVSRDLRPQGILELRNAVFPEISLPNVPPTLVSSSAIKSEVLSLIADFATQKYAQLLSKSVEDCKSEALIVSPLLPQFALLLSNRASVVQQMVNACRLTRSKAGDSGNPNNSSLSNNPTVEELVALADENRGDTPRRVYYLLRAVALANDLKKFGLATEILDDMSEAERKVDLEQWSVLRYTVAAGWAHEQYLDGDTGRVKRILDGVESNTRPFSKIGFLLKFKSHNLDSTAFCLPILNEAEKEMRKSERPFSEKSVFWLQAVKQYSLFNQYLDAANAFEGFVKDLNAEVARNEKSQSPKRPFALSGFGNVISSKLLGDQYQTLITTVDSVGSPTIRIQIQVELMKTALSRVDKIKVNEIKTD